MHDTAPGRRIRALVFDFDGLILDTESAIFHAWSAVWAQRGIELTLDEWVACIGTVDTFDPAAELERRSGRPFTPEEAQRRRDHRDEILARETIRPGIVEYLRDADHLGLGVAIASSSSNDWVTTHLERLGVIEHFVCVTCFDPAGVHAPKPAPDLYHAALERLGVEAHEAIAFEDSVHGVRAAKAAGLACVAVPNDLTRGLDFGEADLVLTSLAEMPLEVLIDTISRMTPCS